MRRTPSPLFSGILYLLLGVVFTFFAIQHLQQTGEWGFLTYMLVLLATFDIGSGIQLIIAHFKIKSMTKK